MYHSNWIEDATHIPRQVWLSDRLVNQIENNSYEIVLQRGVAMRHIKVPMAVMVLLTLEPSLLV